MAYVEDPQTYADVLNNLTEENWHRERALVEAQVARVEQRLENEQVRQLRRDGRCPVCGADAGPVTGGKWNSMRGEQA